jgi:pimeloyl-ACP methyl ester carboxylesterase
MELQNQSNTALSSRSQFIRVHGVKLHYLEWGDATNPPLLLLHGGAAHAHWWDHIAPVLARTHWVLALDLRGHGDSSWSIPPSYEVEDYVADLEAIVTTLGLAPVVVLGHSLGGFIALTYAIIHPEAVRTLVVVDIGARLGGSRYMRLLRSLPPPVYHNEAELFRRFRPLPTETRATPDRLRHIARHSVMSQGDGRLQLKGDRAALVRAPQNISSLLSKLSCPILFVRGQDSRSLSAAALTELVQCCPQACGTEIPAAGHHVFLDNAPAFLKAVCRFLDEMAHDSVNQKLSR